jgi:hypothetical protein
MTVRVHDVSYDRFDTRVNKRGNLVLDRSAQVDLSLNDRKSVSIDIESGAVWDGLSVPWMFQWFLKRYDKMNTLYNISGLVHDVFYAHEGFEVFSRSECDAIFYGMLQLSGKWRIQASLAYISVGIFGVSSWGEDEFGLKDKSKFKIK